MPPFAGMHDAAAAVAGGSLRAVEAIIRGEAEHAFHPGGGLHHAMPERASGFCVYNDVALAVSAARRAGLRVLYVDLDVHHGDGVEAIHRDDPGVLTVSFHESGRYLFPGTGSADEIGEGAAAGTVVNVPFEPLTGETAWLEAVRSVVPPLAAAFGPDIVISQHGADSHAWDPLAHLRVTTTAMGAAARLVDAVAHRSADGRWLATGGGGYEVYRVVPRAWALTWLAGAHREAPDRLPEAWRDRWAAEADRFDAGFLPERFEDAPNAGLGRGPGQDAAELAAAATAIEVRARVLPRLLVVAEERGWWDPSAAAVGSVGPGAGPPTLATFCRRRSSTDVDRATLERLALASRTIAPADAVVGRSILAAAIDRGARLTGAVVGGTLVGVALVAPGSAEGAARRDRGGRAGHGRRGAGLARSGARPGPDPRCRRRGPGSGRGAHREGRPWRPRSGRAARPGRPVGGRGPATDRRRPRPGRRAGGRGRSPALRHPPWGMKKRRAPARRFVGWDPPVPADQPMARTAEAVATITAAAPPMAIASRLLPPHLGSGVDLSRASRAIFASRPRSASSEQSGLVVTGVLLAEVGVHLRPPHSSR